MFYRNKQENTSEPKKHPNFNFKTKPAEKEKKTLTKFSLKRTKRIHQNQKQTLISDLKLKKEKKKKH